jgi:hypothetical protein
LNSFKLRSRSAKSWSNVFIDEDEDEESGEGEPAVRVAPLIAADLDSFSFFGDFVGIEILSSGTAGNEVVDSVSAVDVTFLLFRLVVLAAAIGTSCGIDSTAATTAASSILGFLVRFALGFEVSTLLSLSSVFLLSVGSDSAAFFLPSNVNRLN